MSYADNPYRSTDWILADRAGADERADFIRRTYLHLGGAIAAFVGVEALLLRIPGIENVVGTMVSGWNWLLVMGAFMLVSYIAEKWAVSSTSLSTQYMGLGLYVVAQAVIFVPIMFIASRYYPDAIPAAGLGTLTIFGGMTAIVFFTRKDFSFLRTGLAVAGMAALGLMVCSVLFGFSLGLVFTAGMIALCAGYILYHTSNILHHYHIGQHVAASLALFASVATLFWYVLRLVMALQSRD